MNYKNIGLVALIAFFTKDIISAAAAAGEVNPLKRLMTDKEADRLKALEAMSCAELAKDGRCLENEKFRLSAMFFYHRKIVEEEEEERREKRKREEEERRGRGREKRKREEEERRGREKRKREEDYLKN